MRSEEMALITPSVSAQASAIPFIMPSRRKVGERQTMTPPGISTGLIGEKDSSDGWRHRQQQWQKEKLVVVVVVVLVADYRSWRSNK